MSVGGKKKQYFQVFREEYTRNFPCILKSDKGQHFVFCSICRCDINIGHGGRNDITNHLKCTKHVLNVKSGEENKKISNFFVRENSDSDVIRAECLFTYFLVEHNLPMSVGDHAGPLFRKMFPKSDVANKYGCGRTKSTAIMQEMAADTTQCIVSNLQTVPFSVATDGSNDSDSKLYPIVVTFYDQSQLKIVSRLLSLPDLQGDATGKNIGNLVLNELERFNVPVEHLVAFSADNAAVMLGNKNGVAAVLKQKQEALVVVGCPCHLINLAAEKAAAVLPCKVGDILIDVYYYLEKSVKRKEKLHKFQELYNNEARKILKHICTRWLSLGRSLPRLIDNWDPLQSFFKEEVTTQKQQPTAMPFKIPKIVESRPSSSVGSQSKCETTESSSTSCLEETASTSVDRPASVNKKNQSPCKPMSRSIIVGKPKKIGSSLSLSVSRRPTVEGSSSAAKIKKRQLNSPCDRPSKKFSSNSHSVGPQSSLKNQNFNLSREEKLFMFLSSSVNKAFCLFLLHVTPSFEKTNTMLQCSSPQIHNLRTLLFDLLKELLAKFVKPAALKNVQLDEVKYNSIQNQRQDSEIVIGSQTSRIVNELGEDEKKVFFSSVRKYFTTACDYIVCKFPLKNEVLEKAEVAAIEKIENAKFSDVTFFTDRFPFILSTKDNETRDMAIDELQKQFTLLQLENVSSLVKKEDTVDVKWSTVGNITGIDGHKKYDRLSKVMLSVLTIPHSNAECERVFSLITKNKTKFRSQLSHKCLESMCVMKCNQSGVCYEQNFSESFLVKAKKATAASFKKE